MIMCDVKRVHGFNESGLGFLRVNALNVHSIQFEAIQIQCTLKLVCLKPD